MRLMPTNDAVIAIASAMPINGISTRKVAIGLRVWSVIGLHSPPTEGAAGVLLNTAVMVPSPVT